MICMTTATSASLTNYIALINDTIHVPQIAHASATGIDSHESAGAHENLYLLLTKIGSSVPQTDGLIMD